MKARLCVYLSDETDERLRIASKRPGVSKSSITDEALKEFLSPQRDAPVDAALLRRLDRISRAFERFERDQMILSESLGLFIRYYLTVTPPLPGQDQSAAKALGQKRFEHFVTQLGRRLAGGKNLVRDVMDVVAAQIQEMDDAAELDPLDMEEGGDD